MVTFCFFISIAYSYCYTTEPVKIYPPSRENAIQRSTDMITRHEGLSLEAYEDTLGWSIGYGTRSHPGEVITQQEAWARMSRIVRDGVDKVMRDFPTAHEDQIVAMTSLFYNCWTGYLRVKKEGFEAYKTPEFCEKKGYSGLVKRRAEERMLIFGGK